MKKNRRVDWSKSTEGFYHVPGVVMFNETLTSSSARVLSYLLSLWDCCETVNPSEEKIAKMTGMDERSVRRALGQLTQLGLVTILSSGNGRGRSTEYQLNGSKINEFLGVDLCKVNKEIQVNVSKMSNDEMYQVFRNRYKDI